GRAPLRRIAPRHPAHLGARAVGAPARARAARHDHAPPARYLAAVRRIRTHRARPRTRAGDRRDRQGRHEAQASARRAAEAARSMSRSPAVRARAKAPPIEVRASAKQPLGMPPARFLRDHWQKRPLLIRGAFPHFHKAITPEDLAGLACEEMALS